MPFWCGSKDHRPPLLLLRWKKQGKFGKPGIRSLVAASYRLFRSPHSAVLAFLFLFIFILFFIII